MSKPCSAPGSSRSHILQAIDRMQNYREEFDEAAFLQNEMAQDAVIRNLEVIGEASRNIKQRYPASLLRLLPADCTRWVRCRPGPAPSSPRHPAYPC